MTARTQQRRANHLRLGQIAFLCLFFWKISTPAYSQGLMQLGQFSGGITFGYLRNQTSTDSQRTEPRTFGLKRFEETVQFRGSMNVFDPGFLRFNFGSTVGWFQDNSSVTQRIFGGEPVPFVEEDSLPGGGRLSGYDITVDFLTGRKYSAVAFTNRSHDITTRDFAGSSDRLRRNRGMRLSLKDYWLSHVLSYQSVDLREATQFHGIAGGRNEFRVDRSYAGSRTWDEHNLSLRYEHSKIQERDNRLLNFVTETGSISHRMYSGEENKHLLTSSMHLTRRAGRGDTSSLIWNESFQAHHSESLSTGYQYLFSRFSQGEQGNETTSQTVIASLSHSLYESLATSFGGTWSQTETSGEGGQTSYKLSLATRYRKNLPGEGTLLGNANGSYEILDDRFVGGGLSVFDERHSASLGIPFLLLRPLAIASSVIIRSADGGFVFQEGIDYEVRELGNAVEILVLPSGRIVEGESLLLDYRLRATDPRTTALRGHGYGIGLDYGWINPYYSYNRRVQRLLSGTTGGPLDELRAQTAGVRFRWEKGNFQGTFTNEFRSQESTLIPFRSLSFSQNVAYFPSSTTTMSLSISEILSEFEEPERQTASGSGRFTVGWRPWYAASLEGFYALRLFRDSLTEGENIQSRGFRFIWNMQLFQMLWSYNWNLRERAGDQLRETYLAFRINRRF